MHFPIAKVAVAFLLVANAFLIEGCQKNVEAPAQNRVEQATVEANSKSPWEGNGKLKAVFPDANAEKSIPLDYQTFTFIDGNGLAVTPLPPYLKLATTVMVSPNAGGYKLKAGNEQCASKLVIKMDGQTIAELDPASVSASFHLKTVPTLGAAESQKQLEVWLDSNAKVNFNCNVTITPVK